MSHDTKILRHFTVFVVGVFRWRRVGGAVPLHHPFKTGLLTPHGAPQVQTWQVHPRTKPCSTKNTTNEMKGSHLDMWKHFSKTLRTGVGSQVFLVQIGHWAGQARMRQGVELGSQPAVVWGGEFGAAAEPPHLLLPLLLQDRHDPRQLRRQRRKSAGEKRRRSRRWWGVYLRIGLLSNVWGELPLVLQQLLLLLLLRRLLLLLLLEKELTSLNGHGQKGRSRWIFSTKQKR